jgi:hypothetical protein
MISLQESIKYIGLAAIIFCLIKAFGGDSLDNKSLAALVIGIMILVYFIANDKNKCPRRRNRSEGFNPTDPPIVSSIYPAPQNSDYIPLEGRPEPLNFDVPVGNADPDIENLKDIMGIDKKTYRKLIQEEERAMERIAGGYKDEMIYTDTHPFNTVPLGTQLYGYTYLPPENWFRAYEKPPVCVTDQRCPVVPVYSGNGTSELMEFDSVNNVTQPEGINLRYVKKILNNNIARRAVDEKLRANGQPAAVAMDDTMANYKQPPVVG